ncbi:hypothetical protein GCM10016234_34400 [Tianweitania populi]|uniref:Uncharacterized protein n=1 Tax=Tianweitania populi TaxID=1607949 RepID=A0A8J3DSK3_9HYPH|nr:hypothetical protein GCM10016234_34400 [Tianweitania populi]
MHLLPPVAGAMPAWLVRAGLIAGLQDPALSTLCTTLLRRDAVASACPTGGRAAAIPTNIMRYEQ